jgi:hypothetical protein
MILTQLLDRKGGMNANPIAIARVYAGLGESDSSFAWLGRAFEVGSRNLMDLSYPGFSELRQDPRYRGLMRKVGLD